MTDLIGREAVLDTLVVPLVGRIERRQINLFPPKLVTGNPQRDDEPVLSAWITEFLDGGMLLEHMRGPEDAERFFWSTCWTLTRGRVLLLPRARATDSGVPGEPDATAGAEYAGRLYVAFGRYIRVWNDALQQWTDPVGLVNPILTAPATDAVSVRLGSTDYLIFADGSGYGYTDGSIWSYQLGTGTTLPRARLLAVWDGRLWTLDNQNRLWWTLDGTTWQRVADALFTNAGVLPVSPADVQRLFTFYAQNGQSLLHASTRDGVWLYDHASRTWLQTEFRYTRHPAGGLGAAYYQGALYVSAGANVYQFSPAGVARELGLARDDGLPAHLRGEVTALADGFSWLIAALAATSTAPAAQGALLTGIVTKAQGSTVITGTGTRFTQEVPVGAFLALPGDPVEVRQVVAVTSDTTLVVDVTPSFSASGQARLVDGGSVQTGSGVWQAPDFDPQTGQGALFAWTGTGWHLLWSAGLQGSGIRWLRMTAADEQPRIWWGANGRAYWLPVPRGAFNPLQVPEWEFEPEGRFETAWFNAHRSELDKLGVALKVRATGLSTQETIQIEYGVDNQPTWTPLTTLTQDGAYVFSLGTAGAGLVWKTLRLGFTLRRRADDPRRSPQLHFALVTYLPLLDPLYQYVITVDTSQGAGPYDARQLEAQLDALVRAKRLIPVRLRSENQELVLRRCRVMQHSGYLEPGVDARGRYTLALVEMSDM